MLWGIPPTVIASHPIRVGLGLRGYLVVCILISVPPVREASRLMGLVQKRLDYVYCLWCCSLLSLC